MENLIKALQIFLKYGNPTYPTNCSHDYLFVCVDPILVTDEDKAELNNLGFFVDTEFDGTGFGSFRYGSC